MRSNLIHTFIVLLLGLVLSPAAFSFPGAVPPPIPNPVLVLTSTEPFTMGGKAFIRYNYQVFNYGDFPAEMFAASPQLPPCGTNAKASRTWIDVFNHWGKRLYGFCAFGKPQDLNNVWFAMDADEIPPSWVYIEMNDRQTNTKYKSNLAETCL